jgi:hypothetical protein
MKYSFFIQLSIFVFFSCFTNQGKEVSNQNSLSTPSSSLNDKLKSNKMKIKIGTDTFSATLYDNETTVKLKAMLPLTLNMSELNGNEKYFHLSTDLPTNSTNPKTIQEGDLMLWGSNSLVLFYKTFSTSYNYTKLGRIDNPHGLASAVGSGNVTIIFELE